jgi:hypothetical protein
VLTYEGQHGTGGARVIVCYADGPRPLASRVELYRHTERLGWGTTLPSSRQTGLAICAHALAAHGVEATRAALAPEARRQLDEWATAVRMGQADALAYWLHMDLTREYIKHLPREGFRATVEDIMRVVVRLARQPRSTHAPDHQRQARRHPGR